MNQQANPQPQVGTKRCPDCSRHQGREVRYPATTEYFYVDNARKDGLSGQCRHCRSLIMKKSYNSRNKPTARIPRHMHGQSDVIGLVGLPPGIKRCSNPHCGRVRWATKPFFEADPRSTDKLSDRCSRCLTIDSMLATKTDPPTTTATATASLDAKLEESLRINNAGLPGFDDDGRPY